MGNPKLHSVKVFGDEREIVWYFEDPEQYIA